MAKWTVLLALGAFALGLVGCSGGGTADAPEREGAAPAPQQADPNMQSPEERARAQTGGGEGS
ncbi:MAG: hypothetical protein ACK5XS_08740 [Armatimonadota bacterium]|jgi:hypothetical protein|nr:hypothetical protein [Fimbriimonadaceae bacterium]